MMTKMMMVMIVMISMFRLLYRFQIGNFLDSDDTAVPVILAVLQNFNLVPGCGQVRCIVEPVPTSILAKLLYGVVGGVEVFAVSELFGHTSPVKMKLPVVIFGDKAYNGVADYVSSRKSPACTGLFAFNRPVSAALPGLQPGWIDEDSHDVRDNTDENDHYLLFYKENNDNVYSQPTFHAAISLCEFQHQ